MRSMAGGGHLRLSPGGTPPHPPPPHPPRRPPLAGGGSAQSPRARVIADLRACGIDIARTPSEALADFVETCAPGPDPNRDPALKERGRYSKRNKHHAWMLEKG